MTESVDRRIRREMDRTDDPVLLRALIYRALAQLSQVERLLQISVSFWPFTIREGLEGGLPIERKAEVELVSRALAEQGDE